MYCSAILCIMYYYVHTIHVCCRFKITRRSSSEVFNQANLTSSSLYITHNYITIKYCTFLWHALFNWWSYFHNLMVSSLWLWHCKVFYLIYHCCMQLFIILKFMFTFFSNKNSFICLNFKKNFFCCISYIMRIHWLFFMILVLANLRYCFRRYVFK